MLFRSLQAHIYQFYKDLMGTEQPKVLGLQHNLWGTDPRVPEEENLALSLSFLPEDLDNVVKDTKTDTALGPNGFPVAFFKAFWPELKTLVLQILNGFALGRVDIT